MEQGSRDGAYNPLRSKIGEDDRWVSRLSPGRIEALTDGVFAIAMTLIAIEIGPDALWHSEHWIEFYSYALGFFSLGVFWILHHYMFYFIKRSDGGLVWINILFLAAASLVPFWTRVLNEPPEGKEFFSPFGANLGSVYYGAFMVFTFIVLIGLWFYATKDHRLVDSDIDKRSISVLYKVIIVGATIVGLVTIGMYFVPPIGNLLWVAGVWFIGSTIYARHRLFDRRKNR
jgi:uncharacterized membrane protein